MGASFLNLVATKVTVKGEEQKFVSLHLRQGFNRHHTFTVVVNYLSPNNTFQQTPEKFIGYIGETASISFVHRQTGQSGFQSQVCGAHTLHGRVYRECL